MNPSKEPLNEPSSHEATLAAAAAEKFTSDLGAAAMLHYEHCDLTDIAALGHAIENVRKADRGA